MIHSLRNSRLRTRRSRNAYTPARTRVSLAVRNNPPRPPRYPLTFLNSRRLALVRAAPLMVLIVLHLRNAARQGPRPTVWASVVPPAHVSNPSGPAARPDSVRGSVIHRWVIHRGH